MMDYYDLSKTILFRGTTPEEVETMLNCLGAERRQYAKGQMICRTGDIVSSLGIVLSGSVLVENDDLWGNSTVLDRIGPGQIFAETYALSLIHISKTFAMRQSTRVVYWAGRFLHLFHR